MSMTPAKPPEILDKIVDIVLAHKPTGADKKKKKKRSLDKPKVPRKQ